MLKEQLYTEVDTLLSVGTPEEQEKLEKIIDTFYAQAKQETIEKVREWATNNAFQADGIPVLNYLAFMREIDKIMEER